MTSKSSVPAIVILAAGVSSRMGQPKQLLKIEGETMLMRIAKIAVSTSCHPVIIVTGAYQELIQSSVQNLPVTLVHNADWKQGMGTSVVKGMEKLLEMKPDVGAVILLLADQPLLNRQLLDTLIQTYQISGKPIIASLYKSTQGVPVLFDRDLFNELLQLPANAGAKKLLHTYKDRVETVAFEHGELDVDTPEDFKRVQSIINGAINRER